MADAAEARKIAAEVGFPVILKAAAGGGGRTFSKADRSRFLNGLERLVQAAMRET